MKTCMIFLINFILVFNTHAADKAQTKAVTQNQVQNSQSKISLGLNWKPEPQFGGFYTALIKKYYEKNQLDVKIQEGGSGTPTVQMLSYDKLDYAIVSAEELLIANERNAKNPLVALYAVYKTNPQMIMTHAERNFNSLKEVFQSEGLIALQQGLAYVQFLKKSYHPIKASLVPYLGGIGNFQNNKNYSQQGFVNSEDLLADKAGLKIKKFLIADSGFNPYTSVLATQLKRAKNSPDEVKRVISATQQGWLEYLSSPIETNKHMAMLNKSMDLETMNKAANLQKPLIELKGEKLGEMTSERWKTLQGQLNDLKLLNSKADAKDYYFHE